MHLVSAPAALPEHGADGRPRPARARAILPRRLLLGAALAVSLAACGRKASPEPPPGTPKDAFPKQYPPKGS
ncbi:MAG TPA: lipoprotein [Stellaceae bacterium]|nr:lipoprotein [Stellaceae bacterium]